jgi:hypothetical protein
VKEKYHRQITIDALGQHIEGSALETIIIANLGQDALRYQFGHDHFHYDNNSFVAANAYVDELRLAALAAMQRADVTAARRALGRLTHTVQDLYAHSNYVFLWRDFHPHASVQDIEPELSELLMDVRLRSGRLYYPLEVLSFFAAFRSFVLPALPRDSHAWMNLDAPDRSGFELAFAAAVKRTYAEYLRMADSLTVQQVAQFSGKAVIN